MVKRKRDEVETDLSMFPVGQISVPADFIRKAGYERLETTVADINSKIDFLNQLIDLYNKKRTSQDKLNLFKQIQSTYQSLQDSYNGRILSILPDFQRNIHVDLFNQIKIQKTFLQHELPASEHYSSLPIEQFGTFNELLSEMSPQKVAQILELLSHGANLDIHSLSQLYTSDDKSEEAKYFNNFFCNNSISYLGGANAQNFKITQLDTGEESVIKVEYRFGLPKTAERELRKNMSKEIVAPLYADRQATFFHATHGLITCSLVQTALFHNGDLEAYAKRLSVDQKRVEKAAYLYGQMIDVFLEIGKQGKAFPDSKNTNWMVDNQFDLRIADTKSIIPAMNGQFTRREIYNLGYGVLQTPYCTPPEILEQHGRPIDVDAMHVYIFGKNLYQFLTNCKKDELTDLHDFDKLVFKTPAGELFKKLIQDSIVADPSQRISLIDAKTQLMGIQQVLGLEHQTEASFDTEMDVVTDHETLTEYDSPQTEIEQSTVKDANYCDEVMRIDDENTAAVGSESTISKTRLFKKRRKELFEEEDLDEKKPKPDSV